MILCLVSLRDFSFSLSDTKIDWDAYMSQVCYILSIGIMSILRDLGGLLGFNCLIDLYWQAGIYVS